MISTFFSKLIWLEVGFLNRAGAEIDINVIKNAKRSFFIIEKILKYRKCHTSAWHFPHQTVRRMMINWSPELGTTPISFKPIPCRLFLHRSHFKSLPKPVKLTWWGMPKISFFLLLNNFKLPQVPSSDVRAGHFRYFFTFSIIKNDFFCTFYKVNNLFLHQSYLKSSLPVKLTW